MLSLVLAITVAADPAWVVELKLKPKPLPSYGIYGKDAPDDAVVMPPRRQATLFVDGPAVLELHAHGLMKKLPKKLSSPGKLTIQVDKGPREIVILPATPVEQWFVRKQPFWRVGEEAVFAVELAPGTHRIAIQPTKKLSTGYALSASVVAPDAKPAGEPIAAAEAPVADSPGPESPAYPLSGEVQAEPPAETGAESLAGAGTVPPAVGATESPAEPSVQPPEVEPALGSTEDDEPALVAPPVGPAAESPLIGSPLEAPRQGLRIIAPPPTHTITGSDGVGEFIVMTIESDLNLEITGPGTLVLELHAHRDETRPETLEPVVVGLLLNDVLVNTLSIDEPATDEYSAGSEAYGLSRRIAVRWPIPIGTQRLQLSLSDNAVIGASVRTRFVELGAAGEPLVLDTAAARRGDLRASAGAPPSEVSGAAGLAVLAGIWLPTSSSSIGPAVLVQAQLDIPAIAPSVGVGLTAGFTRLAETFKIEDQRTSDGKGRMRLTSSSVPLWLDVHWAVALPVSGLAVDIGAGGGVILVSSETRSRLGVGKSGLRVSPAAVARANLMMALGPGAVILGVNFVAARPVSADNLHDYGPGGLMPGLGYRVSVGGD